MRLSRAIAALTTLGLAASPLAARAASSPAPTYTAERGAITSFDGTPIVYNLFEPSSASARRPAPVIMRTHGWGGSGEQQGSLSGTTTKLLSAGYAVITWDERGFGESGGEANIDDPQIEGKDASALIDFLAKRPEIARNGPGDPVIGMTGGSYAGGIQLALAAFDHRVDAIAPEITWNDLRYSLFPHDVIKFGWDQLLYGAGLATAATGGLTDPGGPAAIQTGAYAPGIHEAEVKGAALGEPDADTLAFFAGKSLASYGSAHPVRVPTLLMQGSVDTLFNLNDAWANARAISATGAPVKFIAFCGGHVSCPSGYKDGNARDHLDAAILTWFAKYLRHQQVSTGAPVEYSTQDGVWHTALTFPTTSRPGAARLVKAPVSGTMVSEPAPTAAGGGSSYDPIVTDGPSGGQPDTATVPVLAAAGATQIVGIPHVDLDVTGTGLGTHLFFKLVDREAAQVVDLQAESLRLGTPLSAIPQHVSLDLVGVTYRLPAGHHLDLQVATSSLAHVGYRGAGTVTIAGSVRVPTL